MSCGLKEQNNRAKREIKKDRKDSQCMYSFFPKISPVYTSTSLNGSI